jgi:hypothetical protein
MNKTHTRRPATLAALTVAGLGLVAGPAAASSATGPAADEEKHCVAHASGTAPMQCYGTFAEALAKASGGTLTLGPKNAQDALADPAFTARVDASNAAAERANAERAAAGAALAVDTVISIEYSLINYGGSDLIWVGSGTCSTSTNNTDYEVDVMPAGWVNTITAYRTYANCWVKHWENTFQGGASVGYHGSHSYIGGALDNRTSSEQWS